MTNLLKSIRHNGKAVAGLVIMLVFLVMALVPNLIVSGNPATDTKAVSLGMSSKHWLGTTAFGQDIWLQVVHGARPALLIAIISGLLATVLSVLIGVGAAYLGGVWDDALNLFTDVVLVLPTLPLVIVIAGYFSQHSISVMIVVLVVTGWSYGARQLRSQALSLRNRDFLEAARVRGERSSYIIIFELLPNMTSLIVANFLGAALYSLLTASTLEFIGLGDTSSYDWGTMLYWAENNSALQTGAYVWAAAPGLCIALLAAGFALLNNAFDEISNPALRPVRRLRVATS
jgi:peptide/nickel transport system permease protein